MWKMIVAIDKNRGIGKDNKLLFSSKEDMQWFKKITLNNPVIMGRNTWNSLPCKPLPDRLNIVLSYNTDFSVDYPEVLVTRSLGDLSIFSAPPHEWYPFIIGGQQLYSTSLDYCDVVIITEFDAVCSADTFFPPLLDDWFLYSESNSIVENDVSHRHKIYVRNGYLDSNLKFISQIEEKFDYLVWEYF